MMIFNNLGPHTGWNKGPLYYGGGDIGMAAAAITYAASNVFSWSEARKMPERQADANRKVLELQKEHYDDLSKKMRDKLTSAISKYTDNINSLLDSEKFEKAYPTVPKAAPYIPVDPCCEQDKTIECNIENTARADAMVRQINRMNEQNDLVHILSMDPRFLVTLDVHSKSIQDLSRGILPIGDVVEVLTDGAELASLVGRVGNTRKTTARDLGISKLRAQAAGRREFRESVQWMNSAVSPMQRQHDPMQMMLSPGERIQLALHQAQLIQQSLQNKYNRNAQKNPYRLAELQVQIQKHITLLQARMSKALLVNQHVPNYAATVVPKTDNISGLVGAVGSAIQYANSSHFFGGPPGSQDGYRGSLGTSQFNSSDAGYGSTTTDIEYTK